MKLVKFMQSILLWILLSHAGAARADVILHGFDPAVPNSGQIPFLILDVLRGGGITTCEGGRADVPASVSVQGNLIIVKLYMARIFIGSPFCQTGPSSIGLRWPLESALPAGTFTVQVFGDPRSIDPSIFPVLFIGELTVTVLNSSNLSPVPMLALPQLLLFSFALLLVGVWRLWNATSRTSQLTVSLLLAIVTCTSYAQNNAKSLPQLSVELKPGIRIATRVQSAQANTQRASQN